MNWIAIGTAGRKQAVDQAQAAQPGPEEEEQVGRGCQEKVAGGQGRGCRRELPLLARDPNHVQPGEAPLHHPSQDPSLPVQGRGNQFFNFYFYLFFFKLFN